MTEELQQVRARITSTAINAKLSAIYDAMELNHSNDETGEEKAINYIALSVFLRVYLFESGLANVSSIEQVIQDMIFKMNGDLGVSINQNFVTEMRALLESGKLGGGLN